MTTDTLNILLQVTLVGLEPLEPSRAAIASVLIKLPTGGEEKPGTGCSGLAFASTLVNIGMFVWFVCPSILAIAVI